MPWTLSSRLRLMILDFHLACFDGDTRVEDGVRESKRVKPENRITNYQTAGGNFVNSHLLRKTSYVSNSMPNHENEVLVIHL